MAYARTIANATVKKLVKIKSKFFEIFKTFSNLDAMVHQQS